jgi:hypothetical protein
MNTAHTHSRQTFTHEGTIELAKMVIAARNMAAKLMPGSASQKSELLYARRLEKEMRQRADWFERQARRAA